jgi:enamine deaminase RidA (YjgF/YER057c/UK114 family)
MAVEITRCNPTTVPKPTGYTQAIEVKNPQRRVVIAGQVGMAVDGTIPGTGEGQIAQAFANLVAVLEAMGMGTGNLVKITVFLTDRALLPSYRAARAMVLAGDDVPASTLLFVSGLADPRFVVEIEAEAVA